MYYKSFLFGIIKAKTMERNQVYKSFILISENIVGKKLYLDKKHNQVLKNTEYYAIMN